ncbi:MAG: Rieske 2Fe-2S domain-containing protein [Armatimonadetes bacterium]|nr:Rieske 2Fe-2S domain-containing protein [Armatimonadota bacterium]
MEHNLGCVTQIPLGEGRNFVVDGVEVAVFHTRKGVYATQAECPHRRGPLADGLLGGTTVVCPFHAWKFDLTTGQPLMGQCAIQTYPARLSEAGEVLLTFDSQGPLPCPIPQGEEIGAGQAAVGSAVGPARVA